MAELILTDEEKRVAKWLDLDDEAVGRLVKYSQVAILQNTEEDKRVWWWSAALLLVSVAHEMNAETSTFSIDGVTIEGVSIGDWDVVVRQK